MILDSIKEQFKKKGFWKTIEFYFCRVMSKAALKVVGTYAANHGKLHRNYIVFKNRTMQDMTDNAEKIRQEKLEERKKVEAELKEHFGDRFKGFHVKWSEEDAKAEETEESEIAEDAEKESETIGGSVGVNVGKTARKIAAAKTTSQLRAVIAEIKGDMQEVKAGIEKGWCDESEMEKVNSLMAQAQNRMGQVEDREATPEEENMFAMASLM